ncbi:MAG: OB-fold protein [Flavicella sp.]
MWKKTLYLLLVFCFVVVATAVFKYIYRPHKDIQASEASFSVTATYLSNTFSNDIEGATQKFLNKTLEVSGNISELDSLSIALDGVVFGYLSVSSNKPLNTFTTIKGRCIGYDELLEIVKLDQCTILKTN